MRITVPVKDEQVLRTSIRGYFGIADECDEAPVATVRREGDMVVAEGYEGGMFETDIRGLYRAIDASFSRDVWEARYPELLP